MLCAGKAAREPPRPLLRRGFGEREREHVTQRLRRFGREVRNIGGKRLIGGVARIVVLEEMGASEEGVGRHHKPIRRKIRQKRRVVLQTESSGMGRERREILRDERDFSKPAHLLVSRLRIAAPPAAPSHGNSVTKGH